MGGYADELSVKLTAQDDMSQRLKGVRKELKATEQAMVAARRELDNTGSQEAVHELKRLEKQYDQLTASQKHLSRSSSQLRRELDQIRTGAGHTSAAMGATTKAMTRLAAAGAAFVSVQAVSRFMVDSIQKGSALQESLSKSSVVFGRNSAAIVAWSKTSSTAMGLSQQSALEAAGTYGNLFQAFGIGQDKATAMSTTLVQLASDLASFNNTSVDDAVQALRSGLSGETEPLKRYGIALTDARMRAEALSLKIWDGKGALDAAQKSQAAYALMMKDSALAQGDFARTSDGYANTMRILTAEVDNAQAEIGGQLISAIEKAAQAFGGPEGLSAMIRDAGSATADFIAGIGGAIEMLGTFITKLNDVVKIGDNGLVDFMRSIDKIINPLQGLIDKTMQYGSELRAEEEAKAKSIKASEDLYAGYIATWDAGKLAAAGIKDVGDESATAAAKVSALSRAVGKLVGVAGRQQALAGLSKAIKAALAKPSKEGAYEAISAFDNAFRTFKDGSRAQALFVQRNFADIKGTIARSGMSEKMQEQLLKPLRLAKREADNLLNVLKSIDGTQVSIGVSGIPTVQQYRPMSRYATGGLVTGPGTGTSDSVSALLSRGEFVVRDAAVRTLGVDTLHRLNMADKLPAPALPMLPAIHTGGGSSITTTFGGDTNHITINNPQQIDVELALAREARRQENARRTRLAGTR